MGAVGIVVSIVITIYFNKAICLHKSDFRFKIDLFKVKSVCDKLIAESSLMIAYIKAWL